MAEERRSAPRARISGARVTYESATGNPTETDALNLGRGGLFVRTEKPLAVGKRLALEIQVAGELVPWSALGRVVWVREHDEGERRPAGMGVKLIDVEDAVIATIERLVAGRAHAEPGGVESPAQPAPVAPIVSVGPAREKTMLGVGASGFPAPSGRLEPETARAQSTAPEEPAVAQEPSVVLDLVARNTPTHPMRASARRSKETLRPSSPYVETASSPPAAARAKGGRGWLFVLLLLGVAAAAAYLLLGEDLSGMLRGSEPTAAPQTVPVAPPAAPPARTTASATPATTTPAASATTTPAASATTTPAASAGSTSTASAAPAAIPSAPAPSSWLGGARKSVIASAPPPPSHPATTHTATTKKSSADDNNPY